MLRERKDTVNIFITANMEDRLKAVAERHECDVETAQKILRNKESARASYYNYYTGKKWGQAEGYDLCVNTSVLGLRRTEEYIKAFIEQRFQL